MRYQARRAAKTALALLPLLLALAVAAVAAAATAAAGPRPAGEEIGSHSPRAGSPPSVPCLVADSRLPCPCCCIARRPCVLPCTLCRLGVCPEHLPLAPASAPQPGGAPVPACAACFRLRCACLPVLAPGAGQPGTSPSPTGAPCGACCCVACCACAGRSCLEQSERGSAPPLPCAACPLPCCCCCPLCLAHPSVPCLAQAQADKAPTPAPLPAPSRG